LDKWKQTNKLYKNIFMLIDYKSVMFYFIMVSVTQKKWKKNLIKSYLTFSKKERCTKNHLPIMAIGKWGVISQIMRSTEFGNFSFLAYFSYKQTGN